MTLMASNLGRMIFLMRRRLRLVSIVRSGFFLLRAYFARSQWLVMCMVSIILHWGLNLM